MQVVAFISLGPLVLGLVGVAVLVLLGVRFWIVRRRWRDSPGIPIADWETRARLAEARAARAETVVEAGLLPHLARVLRTKFVVGLLRQREKLLETQQNGAERVAGLEQRLATTQVAIQNKLAALEQSTTGPGPSPPAPSDGAAPVPVEPAPRRNPLLKRPPRPDPEPLLIRDVMARRKAADEPEPTPPAPPAPSDDPSPDQRPDAAR